MSRCFPFPPPGYDKKDRPGDDANILIKEKRKEKKHKKDKKDKKKKEKKEKDKKKKEKKEKDKEKSGQKNGEKKDRKRKRKDKDKNKEKEEEDSDGKKIVSSSSHWNGEKLGPFGIQADQTQQGRIELGKRVGKGNGPKEIPSLSKISFKEISVKSSGKELESNYGIFEGGNQKFEDNTEEYRMLNGQKLKVVGKHLENGSLANILSEEQKIVEAAACQEEKVSKKRKERKDKNKHKSSDARGEKHKDRDRERKSKSKDKKQKKEKMGEKLKVKEVSTPLQTKQAENDNNSIDIKTARGSYNIKGSNLNNGRLGKRKEPEMNGLVHGNGNPVNKLARPLSSSKVMQNGVRNDANNPGIRFVMESEAAEAKHKLDAKASCSSSVPENGTKLDSRKTAKSYASEQLEAFNNHHHKAIESLSPLQPSLRIGEKTVPRQSAVKFASKEQGNMVTDYKGKKKVLSSQPIAENGRKLSSQPCNFSSQEKKGAVSKPKFDDDQGMKIGLRKPDAYSTRPPLADQLKETVEAHLKPPHPDAKYLAEILTIPKVEWSDIDDQSWLFAREDHGGKRTKIDSTELEKPKEVWAEALQLSADVTALPYVIPY